MWFQIEALGSRAVAESFLELLEHLELLFDERCLEAIREAHEVMRLMPAGCARDDAHRAAWMHARALRATDLEAADDLGSGGDDGRKVWHSDDLPL